jgi:hypothetical protein
MFAGTTSKLLRTLLATPPEIGRPAFTPGECKFFGSSGGLFSSLMRDGDRRGEAYAYVMKSMTLRTLSPISAVARVMKFT